MMCLCNEVVGEKIHVKNIFISSYEVVEYGIV